MTRIVDSMADLIGGTPLVRLRRLAVGSGAEVLAKLEGWAPSGSDKDRVVQAMLDAAEASGALRPGGTIVEPTSGNIAFALALLAVPRGYRVVLVMPDGMPAGRVDLLRAMGAEVVFSPAAQGMQGSRARAEVLAGERPGAFQPNQFANPLVAQAHEAAADEIWEACEGQLGALVASVATGGSVTGVGRRLRALSRGHVRVFAVQPAVSPVLTGGAAGPHGLLGMGPPFVPPSYDPNVVDEVLSVTEAQCHDTLLRLYRSEGLLSGPAGGAALAAALRLAARTEWAGQRIVALIPDSMERYSNLRFWEAFSVMQPTLPD